MATLSSVKCTFAMDKILQLESQVEFYRRIASAAATNVLAGRLEKRHWEEDAAVIDRKLQTVRVKMTLLQRCLE
jgi:hypothetical protein